MAEPEETPPHGGGGLSRKIGPMPMWLWAVALGGVAGVVWYWRKSKSTTADTSTADDSAAGGEGDSPTSLVPINQGLSEDQTESILDAIKKLQGPPSEGTPTPKPPPLLHPPIPGKPIVKPKPKPKPVAPKTVTVVKWTRDHTPWNSTLWGIANHEHVKGGWQYLQKLNHIKGDPKKALQPGMKIKL